MPGMQRVLLMMGRSTQESGLSHGVRSYVRQHALPWQLRVLPRPEAMVRIERGQLPVDGVIGFVNSDTERAVVEGLRVPVAVMGDAGPRVPLVARVRVDDAAVGGLAADQAVRSGCPHLALIGSWGNRARRFRSAAARAGHHGLEVLRYERGQVDFAAPEDKNRDLVGWLHRQPKPLLAFCHQDKEAVWFAELCAEGGLRVPEDVAILGVDDDVWMCERAAPPLSSVHIPWPLAGYRLALQLHRLLSGSIPENLAVAPLRITERASTRRRRLVDPLVEDVGRYLEMAMAQGPRLGSVAALFGVSRQTVHRHFRSVFGVTAETWWLDRRLAHAAELLQGGTAPVARVARDSGFRSVDAFRRAFGKRYGQSPSLYRRLARG